MDSVRNAKNVASPMSKTTNAADQAFENWWQHYPRKISKQYAEKCWQRLNPSPELQKEMLRSLELHIRYEWTGRSTGFIPHPGTWINQQRWDDWKDEKETDEPMEPPSLICVHWCSSCAVPHDWIHDDEYCGLTKEVACPEAIEKRRKRA